MENKEENKVLLIETPNEQLQNIEEKSEITKFALGDEFHKFEDDTEVKIIL